MSGDVAGIIRISAAVASSPLIYIDVWKTRRVGSCDLVSQQGSINGPTNSTPCWDNSSCNSPHGLWEQQIHWNFLVALYRYHIGYRPIWEIILIYWDTGYMHLMVRESDSKLKGCEFESQSGRDCWWGEWMSSTLSTLNTTTEEVLSKAPNPQLLPGPSINGCPLLWVCVQGVCVCVCVFTAVCVHFGWVKCRAQIPSMGHQTWSYVTSLYL